jgi:arylsulfatase A
LDHLPTYQLYDLESDPGEQINLIDREPQLAEVLKKDLIRLIKNGRSNTGPVMENDGEKIWSQISWIKAD